MKIKYLLYLAPLLWISSSLATKKCETEFESNIIDDKANQTRYTIENLDSKIEIYVDSFIEDYKNLARSSYIARSQESQIGEYRVMEESKPESISNVFKSIRKIQVAGKGIKDNFVLMQINFPKNDFIDKKYIFIGFEDDLSELSTLSIGERVKCLTTVDLDNPDMKYVFTHHASEKSKYLNGSCVKVSDEKLFFNLEENGPKLQKIIGNMVKDEKSKKFELEFSNKSQELSKDIGSLNLDL